MAVGLTAVQIVAPRVGRIDLILRLESTDVQLAIDGATFVQGDGYLVPVGNDFKLSGFDGEIWGLVNSGQPMTVSAMETV